MENDSLRSDLESAQARIVELTGLSEANAQLQTELSEVQAKVTTFEAQATADAEKIVALTAAAEVTEDKIAARASELLAAQGHKAPVNLIDESNLPEAKSITREAFNALSPRQRLNFVQGGGKIS